MMKLLHVGCGPKSKAHTTPGFKADHWSEIRLDIDPGVDPDVNGTMTDMRAVESSSVDAVFSAHNIEHLYPHEVPQALSEFLRVLSDDGFAVITCPDLKSVCALIAQDKLTDPAYIAPVGPIAPLDILYGHRPAMARGNLYMAHRCGFTQKVLTATLASAGFRSVATACRPSSFDLWALASKRERSEAELQQLAREHFPGGIE
jgi:predicted SAM-dependent methyltransferase